MAFSPHMPPNQVHPLANSITSNKHCRHVMLGNASLPFTQVQTSSKSGSAIQCNQLHPDLRMDSLVPCESMSTCQPQVSPGGGIVTHDSCSMASVTYGSRVQHQLPVEGLVPCMNAPAIEMGNSMSCQNAAVSQANTSRRSSSPLHVECNAWREKLRHMSDTLQDHRSAKLSGSLEALHERLRVECDEWNEKLREMSHSLQFQQATVLPVTDQHSLSSSEASELGQTPSTVPRLSGWNLNSKSSADAPKHEILSPVACNQNSMFSPHIACPGGEHSDLGLGASPGSRASSVATTARGVLPQPPGLDLTNLHLKLDSFGKHGDPTHGSCSIDPQPGLQTPGSLSPFRLPGDPTQGSCSIDPQSGGFSPFCLPGGPTQGSCSIEPQPGGLSPFCLPGDEPYVDCLLSPSGYQSVPSPTYRMHHQGDSARRFAAQFDSSEQSKHPSCSSRFEVPRLDFGRLRDDGERPLQTPLRSGPPGAILTPASTQACETPIPMPSPVNVSGATAPASDLRSRFLQSVQNVKNRTPSPVRSHSHGGSPSQLGSASARAFTPDRLERPRVPKASIDVGMRCCSANLAADAGHAWNEEGPIPAAPMMQGFRSLWLQRPPRIPKGKENRSRKSPGEKGQERPHSLAAAARRRMEEKNHEFGLENLSSRGKQAVMKSKGNSSDGSSTPPPYQTETLAERRSFR